MKQIFVYEGWRKDLNRELSSSGGAASKIMESFIDNEGCVCSCKFENNSFIYKIFSKKEDIMEYIGSKYVKSETREIYYELETLLKTGKKVLFIGLPCHVAGLLTYLSKTYDNLFTIDLICHGTPEKTILFDYLSYKKINDINSICFRKKHNFQLYVNNKSLSFEKTQDAYLISFLDGAIYTENCYLCKFARQERISDLTLGDNWGTELCDIEKKKGISLILIQTKKGKELIDNANLYLNDVNISKVLKYNGQLNEPSKKPIYYLKFWNILKNKGLESATKKCIKKKYYKAKIKKIMLKLHLYK